MINKITITDLDGVKKIAKGLTQSDHNVWISALDTDDQKDAEELRNLFNGRGIDYHVEFFYDFDDVDCSEQYAEKFKSKAPNKKHIANFIDFLKPYVDSKDYLNIGVNCFAGISRSTALAIMAWVMSGISTREALENVLQERWVAWPNLRILRLASELLGIDMVSPVKDWKKECEGKIHTPHNCWNM